MLGGQYQAIRDGPLERIASPNMIQQQSTPSDLVDKENKCRVLEHLAFKRFQLQA